MTKVQSIIFDRTRWTPKAAMKWLRRHHDKPIKAMHSTKHFFRYRLHNPHEFHRFITKKLPNGIDLIIGYP